MLARTINVIAIEALAAAQGLGFREQEPAPGTSAALAAVRSVSPKLDEDRPLSGDIVAVGELIDSGALVAAVEEHIGSLP